MSAWPGGRGQRSSLGNRACVCTCRARPCGLVGTMSGAMAKSDARVQGLAFLGRCGHTQTSGAGPEAVELCTQAAHASQGAESEREEGKRLEGAPLRRPHRHPPSTRHSTRTGTLRRPQSMYATIQGLQEAAQLRRLTCRPFSPQGPHRSHCQRPTRQQGHVLPFWHACRHGTLANTVLHSAQSASSASESPSPVPRRPRLAAGSPFPPSARSDRLTAF